MVDQNNSKSPAAEPSRSNHGRRGTFVIALLGGVAGNMLSTAFGQGFGMHRIGWHGGGAWGGPLTPAQIEDRIDRMTKHMAIELDATADQQAKIAGIAKAAVADLRPLREKAQAARSQAVALLTAPTVDRTAIERLRAEQIASPKRRASASRRRWPTPPKC